MKYLKYLAFPFIASVVFCGTSIGLSFVPLINQVDWRIFYGIFFFANIADYHSTNLWAKRYGMGTEEKNPLVREFLLKHKKLNFFIKLIAAPLLFLWIFLCVDTASGLILFNVNMGLGFRAAMALVFTLVAINNYIQLWRRGKETEEK